MRRNHLDDDDEIVKDKGVVRVPLYMRDAASFDGRLNRPGPRTLDMLDGASVPVGHLGWNQRAGEFGFNPSEESARAYEEMKQRQSNMWRSPARAAADTERAAEPPLCADAREDAYQRYKNWLVHAWRGSR
jgi:hypothetical protein